MLVREPSRRWRRKAVRFIDDDRPDRAVILGVRVVEIEEGHS